MIPVSLIDGRSVLMNADLIESIEETAGGAVVVVCGRRIAVTDAPFRLVDAIEGIRDRVRSIARERLRARPAKLLVVPDSPA